MYYEPYLLAYDSRELEMKWCGRHDAGIAKALHTLIMTNMSLARMLWLYPLSCVLSMSTNINASAM